MQKAKRYGPGSDGLLVGGSGGHAFGIVHISAHIRPHISVFEATRTLESLLGVPKNVPLHDFHKPYHAARLKVH